MLRVQEDSLKVLEQQYKALEINKEKSDTINHLNNLKALSTETINKTLTAPSSSDLKNEKSLGNSSSVDNIVTNARTENNLTATIPKDPETLYTKARSLLLENDLKKAEKLFRLFSEKYPDHTLAINALYWTGECRYSQHDYHAAITIFRSMVEQFPKGVKVPDALLKTAYAYLSMDETDRAHHYLKSVVKQYPFSPSGEKAAQKLKAFQ